MDPSKVESVNMPGQIDNWSKIDAYTTVERIDPEKNEVHMAKKTYTYKALVLAPGLEHSCHNIPGLDAMSWDHHSNHVYAHLIDSTARVDRNFYHGWHQFFGDFICYSPKFPYKGEGSDFYALYYEHFLRHDKLVERSA